MTHGNRKRYFPSSRNCEHGAGGLFYGTVYRHVPRAPQKSVAHGKPGRLTPHLSQGYDGVYHTLLGRFSISPQLEQCRCQLYLHSWNSAGARYIYLHSWNSAGARYISTVGIVPVPDISISRVGIVPVPDISISTVGIVPVPDISISTVGIVPVPDTSISIPTVVIVPVPTKVGVGHISPRAYRRCIVRCWYS